MTFAVLYVLYAVALSLALKRAGHQSRSVPTQTRSTSLHPSIHRRKLLIVGATGGTGRHLVALALERGHEVTALVRDPSKLRIEHPGLSIVKGDVLDAESVDAAAAGQEAVVSALGHARYFYPSRILSGGTRNIVKAMERHKISRFVCETSLGVGDSAFRLGIFYTLFTIPVILPFYYWDKARQERIIEKSSVRWVVVRPGLLQNRAARGRYRYGSDVGSFFWSAGISRADVAEFMLDQLESDECLSAAVGIAS